MKKLSGPLVWWACLAFLMALSIAKGSRAEAIVSVVETMLSQSVSLPCLAIQKPHRDAPVLLLFYRPASNIPFFSYDARSGEFWREGTSKIRDERYQERVSLDLSQPKQVFLNLKEVTLEDEGQFTCRVDFLGSPSLTSIINLKVYVNPKRGPKINVSGDQKDKKILSKSELGPFYEGETLNLTCTVLGGHPPPTVTWWQDSRLLDNTTRTVSSNPNRRINDILIGPLSRDLVRLPFKCRSENNPLSEALETMVLIKIHMAPEAVVLPPNPTVSAWVEESLECTAIGSYPKANITWTLNKKHFNYTGIETNQVESDTVSWLRFVPRPEYHKGLLTCSAASPTLDVPAVTSTTTLNVTHPPIVVLQLGSNLRPNQIRQGADVYFDCKTRSNPPVQRIKWLKNKHDVTHDVQGGVIVGGYNLVLQEVQRSDAGNYTCRATNSVGSSESNMLQLSVQYGPMCAQSKIVITAVEGEVVTLSCQVDAYPSNVSFFWLFNNTVDSSRFRQSEYTSEGAFSKLRYVAYTARDYGTIYCWARNVVGTQSDPCAFTLQPAGAPDAVRDCILTNQSAGSLHITCKPGSDGGLTQSFRAEVFAGGSETPVRVLEGMMPIFTVEGLAPGGDYVVRVTSLNKKGASVPVSLEAFTLKVAENRMISGVSSSSNPEEESGTHGEKELSPLIGVIAGGVGVIILLGVVAFFITRRKCIVRERGPELVSTQKIESSSGMVHITTDSSLSQAKAKSSSPQDQLLAGITEETDPFLNEVVELETTIDVQISTGRNGAERGGVFTIPANIPPPPQYCSASCTDLPHSQQALKHCSSPPPCGSQFQLPLSHEHSSYHVEPNPVPTSTHHHHPHPQQTSYTCSIQSPSTLMPFNLKQNPPTMQAQGHSQNTLCRTNSNQHPSNSQPALSCTDYLSTQASKAQSQLHSTCYVQPHPGVQAEFSSSEALIDACITSTHPLGIANSSSGTSVTTQDTILGYSSPKGKQVSWSPSQGENICYLQDEESKSKVAL